MKTTTDRAFSIAKFLYFTGAFGLIGLGVWGFLMGIGVLPKG